MATMIDPVEVKFLADLSQMKRDMEKLKQIVGESAKASEHSVNGLSAAFGGLGRSVAGLASLAGVQQMLSAVNRAAIESEKSQTQLSGALKATGYSAGLTTSEIEGMVDSLAGTTLFDDESIRSASGALLRFRDVQGDTFREALKLSADLAQSLGTDVTSAAQQMGRALSTGEMRSLKSAGVALSEQQLDLAKSLRDTGDAAGSMRVILDAVQKSVGGQAGESNKGLIGTTTELKKAWDDMLEAVGKTDSYQKASTGLIGVLSGALRQIEADIKSSGILGMFESVQMIARLNPQRAPGIKPGRELLDPRFDAEKIKAKEGAARRNAEREMEAFDSASKAFVKERDERMKKASEKARSDLQRMLELGKKNEMDAYYETGGEETMRLVAEKRAMEDSKKAMEETERAQREYTDAVRAHFDPLEKQLAGLAEENEFHGMLASSIEDVKAQRIEEAAAIAERNGASEDQIEFLKREAALRRDIAGQMRLKEVNKKLDDDRKNQEQEWERTAENIERSLTDALMRGFEGGKDMGKNLRDTLWNMFRTLVLQPTIKPLAEGLSKGITGFMQGVLGNIGNLAGSGGAGSMISGGSVQGNADYFYDLHTGGIAGQGGSALKLRDTSIFQSARRMHGGGIAGLAHDEEPAVLRKGEGVFTPEQMRAMGAVTVNIINQTPAQVTTRESMVDGRRQIQVMVQDMVTSMIAGGGADGIMGQTFGARRLGVQRG